jgi:hypothetical protein
MSGTVGANTKDKADHPGLLAAGAQAFNNLLGVITEGLEAGLLQGDDPLKLAGPMWSMVHWIDEDPEDLAARATNDLLDGLGRG